MHQLIASLLLSQGFTNLPDIVCVGYAPNTVGDLHKQVRHRTSAAFANRACEGPMDAAVSISTLTEVAAPLQIIVNQRRQSSLNTGPASQ
jgi:hypothetical protein